MLILHRRSGKMAAKQNSICTCPGVQGSSRTPSPTSVPCSSSNIPPVNLDSATEHLLRLTLQQTNDIELPASVSSGPCPVETEAVNATQAYLRKKAKKREEKEIDQVLKTLQSLESTDDKLTALSKKYAELSEENKTVQNNLKLSQRTLSTISREKDQLQSEHSKAVLAKSRLESLCRELQRQNKLVKDESLARCKDDEEKRKEVAAKFQTTINDIQQQMNDHYAKNTSLRQENIELATKLKGLIEQYELREKHIDKVFETKDIESQLYDARLQQAMLQVNEVKEKHMQDKQQLLLEAMESQKKILILEEKEKALKAQLAVYTEKYDDFQSTLNRSNDVFASFKGEMAKMTKNIKKLERDSSMWRQKWESSNKALISMSEQKLRSDKEASVLQNKVSKLESLCRALQGERKKNADTNSTESGDGFTTVQCLNGDVPKSVASPTPVPSNSSVVPSRGLNEVLPTCSPEACSSVAPLPNLDYPTLPSADTAPLRCSDKALHVPSNDAENLPNCERICSAPSSSSFSCHAESPVNISSSGSDLDKSTIRLVGDDTTCTTVSTVSASSAESDVVDAAQQSEVIPIVCSISLDIQCSSPVVASVMEGDNCGEGGQSSVET